MANEKEQITKKDLNKLKSSLQKLDKNWVQLLVVAIQNEGVKTNNDEFSACNPQKIYNIFNGVIRDGAWKVKAFEKGVEIKEAIEKKISELKEKINK
jgi:hypothetical protein